MEIFSPYYLVSPSRRKPHSLSSSNRIFANITGYDQFSIFAKKSNYQTINYTAHEQKNINENDNSQKFRVKFSESCINRKNKSNLLSDRQFKKQQSQLYQPNDYVQHLKAAMVAEYDKRKANYRMRKEKKGKIKVNSQCINFNPQKHNQNESKLERSRQSQKQLAFKTLNILYKAILDTGFENRKKQSFELQANKFSMVNRLQEGRNHFRFRGEGTIRERSLEKPQKKRIILHRKRLIAKQNESCRKDEEIIPWSTIEDQGIQ